MWLKLTWFILILLGVNAQKNATQQVIKEDLTEEVDYEELPESITVEEVLENNNNIELFATQFENTNNTDELFPNRIVGGRVVDIRAVPYQIGLLYQGSLNCGGSIISRSWILTAAHCIFGLNRSQLSVRAGSNSHNRGGQLITVSRAVYHGRYRSSGISYDIALLRLASPLIYNARVQPVSLPSSARESLPRAYAATGWGTMVENSNSLNARLRGVVLDAISLQRCRNIYRRIGMPVNRRTLCTYTRNKDTCQGDSGGPLVTGYVIYGITSYGNGCAKGIYPGVSTDVRYYLGWIKRVLRRF